MSAVYKATDPNLKRVVAVKLIHAHLADNIQFVTRFEEEAAAVAKLRHSNIIQVFDFDHDEGTYYMVMEFVPGETLIDRLKRLKQVNRHLPVAESLAILSQVCDAVDYAHKRGLVHRDIKPANIMLDVHGQAILMDFGIVKIIGGEKHTATGAVLGTALYMSPEQIKGESAELRSDIYSLGVTLFEMLSGKPPFQADSVMTILMMHLTDPVPDLTDLRDDVPSEVTDIIKKAMAKNPQERYQSALEMAQALRAVLGRLSTQQVPLRSVKPAIQEENTVLDPPGGVLPPAQAQPDATFVEQKSPVRVSPFQPPPSPAADKTAEDTGPMPQVRTAAAGAKASQSGPQKAIIQPFPDASQSVASPGRQSGALPVVKPAASTMTSPAIKKPIPWMLVAGGGVGVLAVLAVIVFVIMIAINQGGNGASQAALSLQASQTAAARVVPLTLLPTATDTQPVTPTLTPTQASTSTPSLEPTATQTLLPSETPTATVPPGILYVRINRITIDDKNRYVVEYETFEYTEVLPGVHVHFFFNTVPPEQAGSPGSGPWILYGGPRPFTGYSVDDKPAGANQMCALVANANHSVQVNSGNCVDLP